MLFWFIQGAQGSCFIFESYMLSQLPLKQNLLQCYHICPYTIRTITRNPHFLILTMYKNWSTYFQCKLDCPIVQFFSSFWSNNAICNNFNSKIRINLELNPSKQTKPHFEIVYFPEISLHMKEMFLPVQQPPIMRNTKIPLQLHLQPYPPQRLKLTPTTEPIQFFHQY